MSSADATGACFSGSSIPIAQLDKVILIGADLTGTDLSGSTLTGSDLRYSNLNGANLENANLTGALYNHQTYWPADFDVERSGAVFYNDKPCIHIRDRSNTRTILTVEGSDLSGVNLAGAVLVDAALCGAQLQRACLRGANLRGANLMFANLHGADLTDAELSDANLRHCKYDKITVWPSGFDPASCGAILDPYS